MNINNDLAVVSGTAKKEEKVIGIYDRGPRFVKPGGGKKVKLPNGNVVTCGGELLRQALSNGGVIVGDEPVQMFYGRPGIDVVNGMEGR